MLTSAEQYILSILFAPTHDDGYRNSLVFYPLKSFVGLTE